MWSWELWINFWQGNKTSCLFFFSLRRDLVCMTVSLKTVRLRKVKSNINRTVEREDWGTPFWEGKKKCLLEKGDKNWKDLPHHGLLSHISFSRNGRFKKKKICTEDGTPTFSRSWRSCLLLASREHKFCSGATTVQMHRPSGSCAELYTCQPSLGLIWVWANQWQTHNTELHYRKKRRWVCNILSKASFLMKFLFLIFKVTKRLNNFL